MRPVAPVSFAPTSGLRLTLGSSTSPVTLDWPSTPPPPSARRLANPHGSSRILSSAPPPLAAHRRGDRGRGRARRRIHAPRSLFVDQGHVLPRDAHARVRRTLRTARKGRRPRHYAQPDVIAILATTGDVPERVAETLGTTESRPRARDAASAPSSTRTATRSNSPRSIPTRSAPRCWPTRSPTQLIASLTTKELDEFTKSVDSASDRVTTRAARPRHACSAVARQSARPVHPEPVRRGREQLRQPLRAVPLEAERRSAHPAVATLEPAQAVPIGTCRVRRAACRGRERPEPLPGGGRDQHLRHAVERVVVRRPGVARGARRVARACSPASVSRSWPTSSIGACARGRMRRAAFELPVLAEVPKLSKRAAAPARPRLGVGATLTSGGGVPRGAHVTALPTGRGRSRTRTHRTRRGKRQRRRPRRALRARTARHRWS